ncbi:outer membrane beta-barrel family protein [Zunongwangia atlantica]|uniref:outer membrane beta-barrel family protein n=1 Tax=Zunongwangia atlantica TaxID=1502297 RepID=UPI001FE3E675|nr:outer membrane beta-barrel family protein [Zunongwangia atlantica]
MLFILVSVKGFSQITGTLIDSTSNEKLPYASITLFNNENELVEGMVTDEAGVFELQGVPKGTYYLEASFMGYKPKTIEGIKVTRRNQEIAIGEVLISPSDEFLEEVMITAGSATVLNKVDRQVYSAVKFQNSKGGTATDILRNLPSISVNGLGEINVRGSSGFEVLLNGRPTQGDAAGILGQLPANAVERVEVITAPSAKYDPEGKAGILNIITKKGAAEGAFTQINVMAGLPSIEPYDNSENPQRYGADITYNVRKEKWNISLGTSYLHNDINGRREGDVFTIINDTLTRFPSDGERSFDEENISGRFTLDYLPDNKNALSLGFYAGKRSKDRTADILYYDNHKITPAEGGERVSTFQYFNENLRIRRSDFALGSIDYSHTFDNKSELSSSFLYEYTMLGGPTTNRNLGYPDTSELLQNEYNTNDNPLHGIRAQIDYKLKPLSIGQLETGYQFRNLDHTGDFVYERRENENEDFELVPEFSSEVNLRRKLHSAYGQLTGSRDNWEYAAGLRAELADRELDLSDKTGDLDTTYYYDYFKLFPSASLQYTFKNDLKVKAAYSKRVERTTTFKMNPFPEREHSETLEQGDPTLLPEFVDIVELGIEKPLKGGNSIFGTLYYRNVENLVNRVNTVYNDTILNRIYSNVGREKAVGLEIGAELKPVEKWTNFIGANVYHNAIEGTFDNQRIDNDSWIYSINANSTYRFSPGTSLQFTFNYLSDHNTAQGEDSRFYSPNLSFQKSFLNDQLTASFQWQNIDLGLLNSNEQSITTARPGEFYTTTNYVYEVDIIRLNLTYSFNNNKNESRFIESEFGKREF